MWGSNEEREDWRMKVDAMCKDEMLGTPSLFWTFTPDPNGSLLLAFWTSADLPNGLPASVDDLTGDNMPSPTYMTELVSGDPVAQAQYYWHCTSALIEILFG